MCILVYTNTKVYILIKRSIYIGSVTIVYVQQNKQNGVLFAVIPSKTVEAMGIKKGDEVTFIVDSPETARFRVVR